MLWKLLVNLCEQLRELHHILVFPFPFAVHFGNDVNRKPRMMFARSRLCHGVFCVLRAIFFGELAHNFLLVLHAAISGVNADFNSLLGERGFERKIRLVGCFFHLGGLVFIHGVHSHKLKALGVIPADWMRFVHKHKVVGLIRRARTCLCAFATYGNR